MSLKTCLYQKGSTLIELLIAIMVVGIVVTALAVGMTYSIKNTAEAKYREYAVGQAQDIIEVLHNERRRMGWVAFVAALPNRPYCVNADFSEISELNEGACTPSQAETLGSTTFTRDLEILGDSETKQIIVTTTWNVGTAEERSVTLQQLFKPRN